MALFSLMSVYLGVSDVFTATLCNMSYTAKFKHFKVLRSRENKDEKCAVRYVPNTTLRVSGVPTITCTCLKIQPSTKGSGSFTSLIQHDLGKIMQGNSSTDGN